MGIYDRNYYRDETDLNLAPSWNQRSAVSTLLIANVAVFAANALFCSGATPRFQGEINEFLLLRAVDLFDPLRFWHLISYGFVHNALNVFHLVFNMMGLYFLGRSVEERYGRNEFYRIYFIALLVCAVGWSLRQLAFGRPNQLLGASGAVECMLMLFVYNFPTARVILFVFPVPAWVLGVFVVLTNFVSQSEDVAVDVHLIGILFATAYFFLGWNFALLGDLPALWRRTVRNATRPKLRIHSGSNSANDAEEADRLLEKIHESGQDSLTSKERKFLENYSRSVRAKKDSP